MVHLKSVLHTFLLRLVVLSIWSLTRTFFWLV